MKNKIKIKKYFSFINLIIIFIICGLSTMAYTQPTVCYDLDETSGVVAVDSFGFHDIVANNASIWTTTGCKLGTGCADSDSEKYFLNMTGNSELDLGANEDLVICAWVKVNTAASGDAIWSSYSTAGTDTSFIQMITETTSSVKSAIRIGGADYNSAAISIGYTSWHFICHGRIADRNLFWVNGTLVSNVSVSVNTIFDSGKHFRFLRHGIGATIDAQIDGIMIFGNAVAASVIPHMAVYYNNGDGLVCADVLIPAPQISILSPSNSDNYITYGNSSVIAIEINASAYDQCWHSINNGANVSNVGCTDFEVVSIIGRNNITVYANNSINQIVSDTVFFFLVYQEPVVVDNSTVLDYGKCPITIAGQMSMWTSIIVTVAIVGAGILVIDAVFGGLLIVFGGISTAFVAFYIHGCIGSIAYIVGIVSIILLVLGFKKIMQ